MEVEKKKKKKKIIPTTRNPHNSDQFHYDFNLKLPIISNRFFDSFPEMNGTLENPARNVIFSDLPLENRDVLQFSGLFSAESYTIPY